MKAHHGGIDSERVSFVSEQSISRKTVKCVVAIEQEILFGECIHLESGAFRCAATDMHGRLREIVTSSEHVLFYGADGTPPSTDDFNAFLERTGRTVIAPQTRQGGAE